YPAHVGLATQLAPGAVLTGHAVDLGVEGSELVHHGVDGVLELQDVAPDVDGDLLRQVAVGDRGGHVGDVPDLTGQVRGHGVDAVGEVLPGSGHALDVGLAATRGAPWRDRRVPFGAKDRSWSTMVLMVSLSCRISPRTSTVIFFERSPSATAVVTAAMLRTCAVRLAAMELTLSVRSFQVPATPWTSAWP